MGPEIGSLFSGYGGLDLAVERRTGGTVIWVAELEPAANAVLDAQLGVPNLGDVSKIEWRKVPRVKILTGGFPCQDVSHAGGQAGIAPGTRSGLWSEFHRAIQVLCPQIVVIENVKGLVSAQAESHLEPCSWCMADRSTEPPLRALGAVLGDLSNLGYDAEWTLVSASEAGAPHQRERIFIVATPNADSIPL